MLSASAAILLDWDGCVAIDNRPLDSAITFLRQVIDRVAVLSNNSTHLPEDFAAILALHGIALPPERILLAGTETVRRYRAPAVPTILLASLRIRRFARESGMQLVRERARQVILIRDTEFNYGKLERVVDALSRGASLVVANNDRSHPGRDGRIVPETGALLAAIQQCLPDVRPDILGKPGPLLFERACAVLGIAPHDAVMIGDNLETDVKGALALGMQPILIGGDTGLTLGHLAELVS